VTDNEDALGWIRRAADGGHGEAAWLLARRLSITATSVGTKGGRGSQRASLFAAQREGCLWLLRAADLGVVPAQVWCTVLTVLRFLFYTPTRPSSGNSVGRTCRAGQKCRA